MLLSEIRQYKPRKPNRRPLFKKPTIEHLILLLILIVLFIVSVLFISIIVPIQAPHSVERPLSVPTAERGFFILLITKPMYKHLQKKFRDWLYKMAVKIICKRLVKRETILTAEYLRKRGFMVTYDSVRMEHYYFEPGIKDRDKITITFEGHYYRLWHGKDRTFIAVEKSVEFFELYYLLVHPDNGRRVGHAVFSKDYANN